jgi:hypothetical protein
MVWLVALLIVIPKTQATELIDPRLIDVKIDHPILFVNKETVKQARSKTELFRAFVNKSKHLYIKADSLDLDLIRQQADKLTTAGRHEGHYINDVGIPFGLYALLTKDPIGIEYCRQLLFSFMDMGVSWHGDGDGHSTGKLFAMGLFYDWIHDYLSPDTRKRVREHLLDSISFLDTNKNAHLLLNPKRFTGSHAHYTHIYALVALLAIRHDIEQDSPARQEQYFQLFGKVVDHWVNGFNPVAAWINEGGGHHMGWAYSQAYTRSLPYLAWESATNEESWFTDWQDNRTYYYLYALRQLQPSRYSMYPVIGDSVSPDWNPARSGLEVAVAASLFNNPYAAWLTDKLGSSDFAKLLYIPEKWPAISPPTNLPLARHFPNSGYVVMRDSWDFNKNTLMVFKSSSFYSFSHNHRDENAFTIFYKGPLAVDSGVYRAGRGYGSEHWYNYYIRSIAHNTMLVYDPKETFRGRKNTIISNDGGQRVINNFNPTLEQMMQGGEYHFDGIKIYENHADFTYSVGDATKAYSSSKLSRFQRSVIYLRNHSYNHPLILVHDRVISKNPTFKKTYLLHSINKPVVSEKTVKISVFALPAPMTGLYQETLLPRNPLIHVIGGRATQQEFLVPNNGMGKPYNYANDIPVEGEAPDRIRRSLREAGEWRVEISPPIPAADDTFLHAISVVDIPQTHAKSAVLYLGSTNVDGILIRDADGKEKSLVLIQRDPGKLQAEIQLPKSAEFNQVLIVGLTSRGTFSINISNSVLSIYSDSSGSFISSDTGTLYLHHSDILPAVDSNTAVTIN